MTLHEAMRAVLLERGGWMERDELAREIAARGLYRRRNGTNAPSDQLRLRARRYSHLFECSDTACSRIRLARVVMHELDFERVIGLLTGWQGQHVSVGVSVTQRSLTAASLCGTLKLAPDPFDPDDPDTVEFVMTDIPGARFELHRDYLVRAGYFPDSRHLIVSLSDAPADENGPETTEIHFSTSGA